MRTSVRTFWCKNFAFFEIRTVSTLTRGVKSVQTFSDKGGGQFFAIWCELLLWTAPYLITQRFN